MISSKTNSGGKLQEALRVWIKNELPDLPRISDETLHLLVQHSAAQQLFEFLTTRVRSAPHIHAIRTALKLNHDKKLRGSSNQNTNEGDKEDKQHDIFISNLKDRIMIAEETLAKLRADLMENPQILHHALRQNNVLNDGYDGIFTGRGGQACATKAAASTILAHQLDTVHLATLKTCSLLRDLGTSATKRSFASSFLRSRANRNGTRSESLKLCVSMLTKNAISNMMDGAHLFAYVSSFVQGINAHVVARLLRPAVREAARKRAFPDDTSCESTTRTFEDMVNKYSLAQESRGIVGTAIDAQLRAGAIWQNQVRVKKIALERTECMKKGKDPNHISGRDLYAMMNGERAAIEYMTHLSLAGKWATVDGDCVDADEVVELREREENVCNALSMSIKKLEQSVVRISCACVHALNTVHSNAREDALRSSRNRDIALRSVCKVRSAVNIVEGAIRGTLQWYGSDMFARKLPAIMSGENVDESQLRAKVCDAWRRMCQFESKALITHARICVEDRTRAILKARQPLMAQVQNALWAEKTRKEKASFVMHDLRTWSTEPAQEAVYRLIVDKMSDDF